MATITDFDTLKAEIQKELAKSDSTTVDTIDRFIQQAESYFNRKLRVQNMETSAAIVQNARTVSLPNDFLKMRNLAYDSVPSAIHYVSLQQMQIMSANFSVERPKTYTIIGKNQIRFGSSPDTTNNMTMVYYQRIPTLSVVNTTNWLIETYPDVYLYRSLHHAFKFLRNEAEAEHHRILAEAIVQEIEASDEDDLGAGPGMHPRVEGYVV